MSRHQSTKITPGLGRKYPKEYTAWADAKQRCRNSKCAAFKKYGARGINICDKWADSFADFMSDVGPAPSKKHTLDRFPNKQGNYEPGNVRWATWAQQRRNVSSNVEFTWNGQTKCLVDWAAFVGLRPSVLRIRIKKRGLEKALTTAPCQRARDNQKGKLVKFRGQTMTLAEIAKATGAGRNFYCRVRRGWSIEDAAMIGKNGRYKKRDS